MKAFFALFLFAGSVAMARVEPPLPAWDSEERSKMLEDGWMDGGVLLDFESIPGEEEVEELPPSIESPTVEELAEGPEDESEVAEEYLAAYFEAKPPGHLVDPQGLIGTRERKDLEAFLDYHAGGASIDIYVYAFGANQRIPSDVREEEVVERLYSVGKPAAVIYYYVGSPQRSSMYLSPVITDTVSAAEQRRALESSVMEAFGSTIPFDQLKAFLVQMSIRIYWMERMTQGTAAETMESIPDGESARAFPRKSRPPEQALEIPSWMKLFAGAVATAFGALLTLICSVAWWRSRQRFHFPEFEVEPRLGGSHSAGIGAVISFGSAAVPPAMQRNRVPDYMRRA